MALDVVATRVGMIWSLVRRVDDDKHCFIVSRLRGNDGGIAALH